MPYRWVYLYRLDNSLRYWNRLLLLLFLYIFELWFSFPVFGNLILHSIFVFGLIITVPLLAANNWAHHLHTRGIFEGYMRVASKQKWLEVHGLQHWVEFYTEYGVNLQVKG